MPDAEPSVVCSTRWGAISGGESVVESRAGVKVIADMPATGRFLDSEEFAISVNDCGSSMIEFTAKDIDLISNDSRARGGTQHKQCTPGRPSNGAVWYPMVL